MRYLVPRSVAEALSALAGRNFSILAGGTDVYPALGDGAALKEDTLDIRRLKDLHGVYRRDCGWWIGATTSWSDLQAARLPECFEGLKAAAREVGAVQIQNAGTVVGNLCNASPAADGVPPLLTLDAEVELLSQGAQRRVALARFITGSRRTVLRPDELVSGIFIPDIPRAASGFFKLGARHYLVISIVMAAAVIIPDRQGCVAQARIAVGSCSAVAQRLPALEAELQGVPFTPEALASKVAQEQLDVLTPLDDHRASRSYRMSAAQEILRRLLATLALEFELV